MPYLAKTVRTALRKAQSFLSTDPAESLVIAEALLPRVKNHPRLMADTIGMVGLARQFSGDRDGALAAFRETLLLEDRPLQQGHLYCKWAILEIERHQLDSALDKVSKGYFLIAQSNPSGPDMAQGLVARGVCYRHRGRVRDAEADYSLALGRYIHPKKEPKLHYTAIHNLALCYVYGTGGLERITRALDGLKEVERTLHRYKIKMESMQGGMLLWTRGIVLGMVGAYERSEHLYRQAQQAFKKIGATTEWLRVSLDIGEIYLNSNKWGTVLGIVRDMLKVATDLETVAALNLYCRALTQGNLTEKVIGKVYHTIHGEGRKVPIVGDLQDDRGNAIGF